MKITQILEAVKPEETITITIGVCGDAAQRVAQLLHNIANVCSMGCSRDWGILDGDSDETKYRVGFDGDGADKLTNIRINDIPVKKFLKL